MSYKPIPKEISDKNIKELNLSNKLYKKLTSIGLKTIDSLTAYIDYGLFSLGEKYFVEVLTKLEDRYHIVEHPIYLALVLEEK